jgi:putative transposase
MFERIGEGYHITLVEWNHDIDHIHVMFKTHPKTELTKFINSYKSASSRLVKKEYPAIKNCLWKSMFWSKSFCLLTTGGAPIEVIKKYIQDQGSNNK